MTITEVTNPFAFFTDTDGKALENGHIYVGVAGLDAKTNQIPVYWDEAVTIPAVQPVRTVEGYPDNAGTPSKLFAATDFSISVENAAEVLVYSDLQSGSPDDQILTADFTIDKAGFSYSFIGNGDFFVTADDGSDNESTITVNSSLAKLEAFADSVNGTSIEANRTGGLNIFDIRNGLKVFEIQSGAVRGFQQFTDAEGDVSRVEVREDGEVRLATNTGVIRFSNEDASSAAPLPLGSDGNDFVLRIASNGDLERMHPDAFRILGGSGAPVDGTTVAYNRHQLYVDRSVPILYYANVKSTDPDDSGVGSVWLPI